MKKIIVFGTGKRLKMLLDNHSAWDGVEIMAFCDNNIEKQNQLFNNLKVIAPSELYKYEYDAIYISSEKFFDEIKMQLVNECNIPEDKIKLITVTEGKYYEELSYWKDKYECEGKKFKNSHYRELMLGIAEESDDKFMKGKVVADFGCGPRGSLAWTDRPLIRFGIDVLANKYLETFGDELIRHNMIYVTSSEAKIPMPDSFVDCLYTINSLDHVYDLEQMVSELMRILKPRGLFMASFNLNEPKTETEPQTLTEKVIRETVLKYIEVLSYRMAYKLEGDVYRNFRENNLIDTSDDNIPCILWLKGKKL